MYLLAPSGFKELSNQSKWFKKPVARKLRAEKGVEFGFELKGEPATIKETPHLYWGYHLPANLTAEWYYHPEKRSKIFNQLSKIAQLKPQYVNIHGVKLWWKPKAKDYIRRYENRSDTEEYLKILAAMEDFIQTTKKIFSNLTLENTIICDYYRDGQDILNQTSYQATAGALNDLLALKKKTGVEILLDLEHLIVSLNFLNRAKNYRRLKKEKFELNPQEAKISQIYGFKIKKGFVPYAEPKIDLEDFVRKIGAKKYHLTGSTQDIRANRDITHGPIKVDDKVFRKNLRLVLAQKPETILIETANSNDNACYHYLRPNETELSFYNLCEILLEEL